MKNLIITLLLSLMSFMAYSQDCPCSQSIVQQVDSICKANHIKECYVYIGAATNVSDAYSANFRFERNFLVLDDDKYYNMNKLARFELEIREKNNKKNNNNWINIYFQSQ